MFFIIETFPYTGYVSTYQWAEMKHRGPYHHVSSAVSREWGKRRRNKEGLVKRKMKTKYQNAKIQTVSYLEKMQKANFFESF